jgi:hypothetical protein
MAVTHKVVFYPVANGDTAQIILENGRRVLLDFNHCANAEDETNPAIDLKQRLKDELEEVDRDYFDVVAFTHADNDHIRGSTEFFWLEHAKKYHGEGRIKINELWVPAAMLLEVADRDHQSEEFVLWRQEARHRLLEGKGIRVFSKPQALLDWLHPKLEEREEETSARDHLFVDAGTIVPEFSLGSDGVEFFTHSPFIEHVDGEGDVIRNDAALVFNVRFEADGTTSDYLHFGDTAWENVELIVETTQSHGNEDQLRWDLFNIPHHCSYKSLSDEKGKKETEPKPKVKELLLMGNADSYLISSSKPVPDETDAYDNVQPPHIQARKAYESHMRQVKGRKFLVTMEQPSTSAPEPMTFEITSGGVAWVQPEKKGRAAIITSPAPRAG